MPISTLEDYFPNNLGASQMGSDMDLDNNMYQIKEQNTASENFYVKTN